MCFLLKNVRIIDSQSEFHNQQADLLIEDGIITEIAAANSLKAPSDCQLIQQEGLHVSPSWVDMGVHLNEPGYEFKESAAQLGEAALKGGFSHIVCYPNTQPLVGNAQILQSLQRKTAEFPVEFLFTGTITENAAGKELGELYEMQQEGAIAFSDGGHTIESVEVRKRVMEYSQSFQALLICQPNTPSLTQAGQMNEGEVSTRLGMRGIAEIAESMSVAQWIELLSYVPSRVHLQSLTSPRGLDMIRREKPFSTGIALPYLILKDSDLQSFEANYKLFPPLRSETQQQALIQGLQEGLFDVLYSDHHAQGIEEKKLEFEQAEAGMLGLQTFFALANQHLVQTGIMELGKLVEMISVNPRRILGLEQRSIQTNQQAELSLFLPNKTWQLTEKDIPSRAKNSPFLHQELVGKPYGVMLGGRLYEVV